MIREELAKRRLPSPFVDENGEQITTAEQWEKQREKIKELLSYEEYGNLPGKPDQLFFSTVSSNSRFCASEATLEKIIMTIVMNGRAFSFPFYFTYPNKPGKFPTVILINFKDDVPHRYLPSEEINSQDVAVASFCYTDFTADDWDFTNGFSGLLFPDGKRKPHDTGKIAMWAWAAMRIFDYLETRDNVDLKNVSVAGHSRLGKTALYAGAFDERFAFAYSNDSGCGGAAISRDKVGEDLTAVYTRFGFWFCEHFAKYQGKEHDMPHDQHFMHALVAPRNLYVASAETDQWADPESEYLGCIAAGKAYEYYGKKTLVHPDRFPEVNEVLHEGSIGYHLRSGSHYFSRRDWNNFIKYMKENKR